MKKIYLFLIFLFLIIFLILLIDLPISRLEDPRIGKVFFTPKKSLLCVIRFFSFIFLLLIVTFYGRFIIRKLRINSDNLLEEFLISSAIGIVLFTFYSFILLSIGIFYRIPVIIFILPIFIFHKKLLEWISEILKAISSKMESTTLFEGTFLFIPIILLFPSFILLFSPPLYWDELVYHLFIPKTYISSHRFVSPEYLIYFDAPHNINIFYGFISSLFGNTSLCVFFHSFMGIGSTLLIYLLGRKYFSSGAGKIAALIFITAPAITKELRIAYVDLGSTFFFLLSIYTFMKGYENKSLKYFSLAGIFLGFTIGIKYPAIYCAVTFLPFFFFPLKEEKRKYLFIFWGTTFITFFPWLLKNFIMTGNPIYPNLYVLFEGKNWNRNLSILLNEWLQGMGMGMGHNFNDFFKLPWRLSVKGWYQYELFADTISPFFFFPLIFLPLVILREYKESKINLKIFIFLGMGLIFLICWFYGSQQVRFLIPGLALFAIVSGYAIDSILSSIINFLKIKESPDKQIIPLNKWLLLVTYIFIACYSVGVEQEAYDFVQPAFHVSFGNMEIPEYITRIRRSNSYNAVMWINKNLPKNSKILMFFENRGFYLEREFIADGTFEASRIIENLMRLDSAYKWLKWMKDKGITHILWHDGHWKGNSGEFIRRHYPDFYPRYEDFQKNHLEKPIEIEDIKIFSIKYT